MSRSNNPIKRIREYCIQCVANQPKEVELCPITDCPLYDFRFGKNPFRQKVERNLTEEQKDALRTRLAEARKNKGKNQETSQ